MRTKQGREMILKIEISDSELARHLGLSRQAFLKRKKKQEIYDLVYKWLTTGLQLPKCNSLEISEKDKNLVDNRLTSGLQSEEKKSDIKDKEDIDPIKEKENNININLQKEDIPVATPQSPPKRTDDLSQYEWADDAIRPVLQGWLDYKRKIGQTYKTELGLKKLHTQLMRWSDGNPAKAQAIVDQSQMNNWQGLFELKGEKKEEIGVVINNQPKKEEEYGFDW